MNSLPPETKLCNCAGCKRELLSRSARDWYENELTFEEQRSVKKIIGCAAFQDPFLAGRILGRPYCETCLLVRERGMDA